MAELQRFNMDKNMKKLTKEELNQRASNKAFSKIFHLEEDFKPYLTKFIWKDSFR